MPKKCPPGVICIENISLIFFIIIGIIIIYLGYNKTESKNEKNDLNYSNVIYPNNSDIIGNTKLTPFYNKGYTTNNNDILLNPYSPPFRDNRFINTEIPSNIPIMPINVSTQSFNTNYRQIGILTRINGPETILALMGRPLFSNRDKWQFYTMSDKNNSVKLPVTHKQRSCTSDTGCDNIYNGDTVYVEGYNDAFKATIYDNAVQQYIPFI